MQPHSCSCRAAGLQQTSESWAHGSMRSSKPLFPRANPSSVPKAVCSLSVGNAELLLKQTLHEVTKALDLLLLDLALGAAMNQLASPTEVVANEVFPFALRPSEGLREAFAYWPHIGGVWHRNHLHDEPKVQVLGH
jgi:hypothetical protein